VGAIAASAPAPRVAELRLFPRQARFVQSLAQQPAYIGGIGSGKSYAGAAKVLTKIATPGVGTIYAPTYAMLRDATRRSLIDLLTQLGVEHRLHRSENRITIISTGHEILCRSLDNPDGLRGPNLSWAWVDEAAFIPREAWQIVLGRVRVGDKAQAWITSTPKGRNWLWEMWERDATGNELDPYRPLFRVRTSENPELPDGFVDSLGYSGAFAEQELLGEFVAFEGLVYKAFRRSTHVAQQDVEHWRAIVAADIGTRNPTAILSLYQAGDERIHLARETYRRGMASSEIVAAICEAADSCKAEAIVLDPSAAGIIADLQRAGYPAVRGDNAIADGIARVTDALEHGLTIDPGCVATISEMESYRYPEGSRSGSENPIKDSDHALDALRYGISYLNGKQLSGRLFV
jgi:PBSX family phage terminase large subunit